MAAGCCLVKMRRSEGLEVNTVVNIQDTYPGRYMLLKDWGKFSGYTKDAFNAKMRAGVWIEGKHWIKGPDGKIQIDWRAMDAWTEENYEQEFLQNARAS